ncbi:MAG: hypothetical protein ACREL3_05090 [Gemmatimonadales bacterium]
MRVARVAALVVPGVIACQPGTTRPSFTPLPEAEMVEVRLQPLEATKRLAEAFEADSIPPRRIELQDGYIESHWFDSATGQPATARPIGTRVVRVRAWADPGRPGFTLLIAESVYRPVADPSLPPRELERELPREHPVAAKVRAALQDLVKKYGGPPAAEPVQPGARQGESSTPPEDTPPPQDEP